MNNIKSLRQAKNIKQEDLAAMLHVSRPTLSTWETGLYQPDLDSLLELANILDTTIDNLVGAKKKDLVIISRTDFEALKTARDIINRIEKENPQIQSDN